jgi:hypothetical protein
MVGLEVLGQPLSEHRPFPGRPAGDRPWLDVAAKEQADEEVPLNDLGVGSDRGTLYNVALTEGTSMTSASNASLIMATSPVWGMLLAAGLSVEPLRATNVIGAVVSLVGVVIILGRGLEGGGSSLVGIS